MAAPFPGALLVFGEGACQELRLPGAGVLVIRPDVARTGSLSRAPLELTAKTRLVRRHEGWESSAAAPR